jgi:hypothetical protein
LAKSAHVDPPGGAAGALSACISAGVLKLADAVFPPLTTIVPVKSGPACALDAPRVAWVGRGVVACELGADVRAQPEPASVAATPLRAMAANLLTAAPRQRGQSGAAPVGELKDAQPDIGESP